MHANLFLKVHDGSDESGAVLPVHRKSGFNLFVQGDLHGLNILGRILTAPADGRGDFEGTSHAGGHFSGLGDGGADTLGSGGRAFDCGWTRGCPPGGPSPSLFSTPAPAASLV